MTKMMRLEFRRVADLSVQRRPPKNSYEKLEGRRFCVVALADNKEQIDQEFMNGLFPGALHYTVDMFIRRLIVTGYLGHMLELAQKPLVQAGDGVRIADIEETIRVTASPLFIGTDGVYAWFSHSYSPNDDCERPLVCIAGEKDKLAVFLDEAVRTWSRIRFNPGGIRTDLEYALSYIISMAD